MSVVPASTWASSRSTGSGPVGRPVVGAGPAPAPAVGASVVSASTTIWNLPGQRIQTWAGPLRGGLRPTPPPGRTRSPGAPEFVCRLHRPSSVHVVIVLSRRDLVPDLHPPGAAPAGDRPVRFRPASGATRTWRTSSSPWSGPWAARCGGCSGTRSPRRSAEPAVAWASQPGQAGQLGPVGSVKRRRAPARTRAGRPLCAARPDAGPPRRNCGVRPAPPPPPRSARRCRSGPPARPSAGPPRR